MRSLGSILGVWAHPDDECYLSGGLMAAAVRAGCRVVCVTATRGENADPDRWDPPELARIRERELYEALSILGVTEHRWLGYEDGACHRVDPRSAAERVAQIVDEVRPDTVLTFGPDGMTGHGDHRAVSAWTERALVLAGSDAKLHYATHTPEWVEAFEAMARELDVMMGADVLPVTPPDALAIDHRVDGELLDLKERAMLAQESQVHDLRSRVGADAYRELLREEAFRHP